MRCFNINWLRSSQNLKKKVTPVEACKVHAQHIFLVLYQIACIKSLSSDKMPIAQVSSLGRFRSTKGIVSTPVPMRGGYSLIAINKKRYMTHIVVATTFKLPRKPGQNFVNHKNLDRKDARVSNLEWVTRSENIKHSYEMNKQRKCNANKRVKPVRGRKIGTTEWILYSGGASEAARTLNVSVGRISACCAHAYDAKQTGGYEFEWDKPTEAALLEGEEWRQVSDDGAAVSSFGRYRNIYGVVSTPSTGADGYVTIRFGGKSRKMHRVIASAFGLPQQEGEDQIDHIDGNRSNNHLSNLQWVSRAENVRRSYQNNQSRASNASRLSKPICARKGGSIEWTLYNGANEAAKCLKLHRSGIVTCCSKKITEYGGYEFKYDAPDSLPSEVWKDVVLPEVT